MALSGWGRARHASAKAFRPERLAAAEAAVRSRPDGGLIAYGGGRSYGDAALNDDGHVLLSERLDRVLDLDAENATLVTEPGVTLRALQRILVPRGFMLPVLPGTGFATIGGAVANDVHGKNHDRHGSLGDHVEWFELLTADGTLQKVSPQSDPALFAARVGGLGLTGIMTSVCLKLHPAPSNAVDLRERRVRDLDHFFELFASARETATFSVGWIDALARGGGMGRGILETAELSTESVPPESGRMRRVPFDMPGILLNRLSIKAFNAAYYRHVPDAGRDRRLGFDRFFHPLDSITDWNRLYGRRGFHQFQCVIPEAESRAGIGQLLEAISGAGTGSFLAVLKTLGGPGRGYLSFPLRGYTLALDFPARGGVDALLSRLERITLDHGGRVYLAKDSRVSAEGFAAMYRGVDDFREVLAKVDPDGLFVSDLARRLKIRGDAA
jgi:decaprenylphospho-beta-D-ribofuranose 2-oxidase